MSGRPGCPRARQRRLVAVLRLAGQPRGEVPELPAFPPRQAWLDRR
ncbi:MAG: hypothetical protein R3F11_11400 [Verrucomicrobiales bacterium]